MRTKPKAPKNTHYAAILIVVLVVAIIVSAVAMMMNGQGLVDDIENEQIRPPMFPEDLPPSLPDAGGDQTPPSLPSDDNIAPPPLPEFP